MNYYPKRVIDMVNEYRKSERKKFWMKVFRIILATVLIGGAIYLFYV